MMRIAALSIILLAVSAAAGQLEVTLPLEPSAVRVDDRGVTTSVTGRGMGLLEIVGAPTLPAYTERIALPPGCAATRVEIVSEEYRRLPGRYRVMAHQPPVPISLMDGSHETVPPDPDIYSSSEFYPGSPLEWRGSSVILGIPVAYLQVRPARWNPADGSLEVLTELTVTVDYESVPGASTVSRRSLQSEMRSMETVMNVVANPEGVLGSGAAIVGSRDLAFGEYVIIATEEYQSRAQEIADWKTAKGVPASVYTTGWIEANYSFYDLEQEIRAFLTDCRDEGVEYVLIYGDDDVIPGRDAKISDGGMTEEYPPVDLYWSDINDMVPGVDLWDSNNNHVWGQFEIDQVDYHPDLWLGRASVNSEADCQAFNQKVMVYEQVQVTDYFGASAIEERIGYTTELLWPDCYGSAGAELISEYVPGSWTEEKCYDSEGMNSVAITDSMLNAGPHHVYHASHGNATLFSLPGGMYTTAHFMNLQNISSGGLPAIWNSISCLIGKLDAPECMGDAWNNSPQGGGFGAFNARYGYGNPGNPGYGTSEILCRYFYDVMWNDDLYILGVAHAMGDDEMSPPGGHLQDWCVKEYNLFGDPELPMWFAHPVPLSASHDASISGATTVTVTVSAEGSPVEGARVCLQKGDWKTGEIYLVDNTDASGQCSFYLNPASTGTVSVVAWARDRISYQGTIDVTDTGLEDGTGNGVTTIGDPYPVPALSSVTVPLRLAEGGSVRMDVYDVAGRLCASVAHPDLAAGTQSLTWELSDESGRPVPSGIYRVRIAGSDWAGTAVVMVLR